MLPPSSPVRQVKYAARLSLQPLTASHAQTSVMQLANAHLSHGVGLAGGAHVPPSSLDEPPEPPVPEPPEPPAVVVEVPPEPAAPVAVEVVPPSPLSDVTSVVHAPKIAITADAAAHLVMFIIRPSPRK